MQGDPGPALLDRWSRRIRYLRVSVTDRCSYRCAYCMPADGWAKVPRDDLPTLEELAHIITLLVELGVERVRFTGGEPLLRRGLVDLVARVAGLSGVREVALTTNGHLLGRYAAALRRAGLARVNISLDTFDPARFAAITRGGELAPVLSGLALAEAAGFTDVRINTVAIRGFNDHELADLAVNCLERGWTPRFIELMPIGQLHFSTPAARMSEAEVLARLAERLPLAPQSRAADGAPRGPARYFVVTRGPLAGGRIGLISPLSDSHFCSTCNRARLTARGSLRACLAEDAEVSILHALRRGSARSDLIRLIGDAVRGKREAHRMTDSASAPQSAMTAIGG